MDLDTKFEQKRGGRGYFCSNIRKILEEVNAKGLSDLEVAEIAGIALSTVAKWRRDNAADKKYAIRFITRLKAIKNSESFNQPTQTQKDEKVTEIVLSVDGQRLGIITIFNEIFKKLS
jgi:transcriptional regulator with XRE-family HTH domain